MTLISPLVEKPIAELAAFSQELAAACRHCDLDSEKASQVMSDAVVAECVKCNIHVRGDELLLIATATSDPSVHAKIKRMNLGYCARDGCESLTYLLRFNQTAGLDWEKFQEHMEAARNKRLQFFAAEAAAKRVMQQKAKQWYLRRLAIMVGVILILLVIRQWYTGGRIPLLREPEKFRVTPATEPPDHTEEQEVAS